MDRGDNTIRPEGDLKPHPEDTKHLIQSASSALAALGMRWDPSLCGTTTSRDRSTALWRGWWGVFGPGGGRICGMSSVDFGE
jgi:hypothetical protein